MKNHFTIVTTSYILLTLFEFYNLKAIAGISNSKYLITLQ